jgi:hypothetical protein
MTQTKTIVAAQAAQAAEETFDLLNHIAWTDRIKPELERTKSALQAQLTRSVLGMPLTVNVNGQTMVVTKEQIAGQIYGIDFITQLFEKILTKGKSALEYLEQSGFHLT